MQKEMKGFRLSPQQKRLWLLSQGDRSLYYTRQAILLEGDLDIELLRQSVQVVVGRHEILRTTFYRQPGNPAPIQVIHQSGQPLWQMAEEAGCQNGHPSIDVAMPFGQNREHLFDLENGPLLYLKLIHLGSARHLLLIDLTALCSDAWTLKNLFYEICRAYQANSESMAQWDEPFQYLQLSEWRHALLESEEATEGRTFWLRQSQANTSLSLPFERQTSTGMRIDVAVIEIALEDELAPRIQSSAERRQVSLAVWLLACWQTLLWRVTKQPTITVERLFDGRKYDEFKESLGLFATFIPIHCQFDEGLEFLEVLRRVEQAVRDAEAWQEYWAPEEQGENEAPKDGRVSFEYIEWAGKTVAGGVSFSVSQQQVGLNRFDLKLSCSQREGHLFVELFFDREVFSIDIIRRLADQYRQLLRATAESAASAVGSLELIDEAERKRLLSEWNDTKREFPQQVCLHQLFEAQVSRAPDAAAVVDGEQHLSYRELNARANQLARHLQKLGGGPEVRIGLCVERSVEMLVALLGALKVGGVYAPLDASLPRERLAFMIADANLSILLTKQNLQGLFPQGDFQKVLLDGDGSEIARHDRQDLPNQTDAQNPVYIIYTSGSTGNPKGVIITHRGLINYLNWSTVAYCDAYARGTPVHSSLSFDLTVTSLFTPLLNGETIFLVPEAEGVEGLSSLLARGQYFNLVKLTPSHLDLLSRTLPGANATSHTRRLVVGGEALWSQSLDFWRRHAPQTRVINEYGPTETVVGCCVYDLAAGEIEDGAVPIGRPIANTRLYVLDRGMQLTPTGAVGELYIGGEGVARGYVNQPGMTAERFVPDPYGSEPGSRIYRSGDLARYLSDGNLEYLGRADHQVKIRGYRIELGEIEAALAKHEAIRDCAVIARKDASGEKQLVAYVVSSDERGAHFSDLLRFLAEKLPSYMVPTSFVSLEALPLTSNGKLDYQALPAPEVSRVKLKEDYAAPRNAIEEVLVAIWSEALAVDSMGIHDNFFALGGDSMRSIRVTAQVKARGWNISPQDIFHYQTVSQMAAHIRDAQGGPSLFRRTQPFELISEEDRRKLPDDVEDAYPLGMIQAGMLYHTQLTPDAPIYHNVCSYRTRAHLEIDALRRAVQRVVERHPLLRTSFDLTNYSEPLQLVHKTAQMDVTVIDLRHLPNEEQERILAEFGRSEWRRLFDLKTPPFIRVHIHLRTDQTFQLTITDSHALIDGWSLTSTFAEIFSLYFTLLETGVLPHEPAPHVSYRDFIALEREALASEDCRKYWLSKLEGCQPVRLPRWRSAARQPGRARVRIHPIPITVETGEKLRQLARSLAVPLKSVLLAAHLRVLSLISGQAEFLAGIGANGRPEEVDGEQVRGLFLNVVPFRFRLPQGTWKDLVRQTFESEMEMLPYRRYPLPALQQRFGKQVLLETDFEYLHFHSVEKLLRNHQIEFLENWDFSETNFVMAPIFHADPLTSQLTLRLDCDTTELSDEQIELYGGYYARALSLMAIEPDRGLDSTDLLSIEERSLLQISGQIEWDQTACGLTPAMWAHKLFTAQAQRSPHRLALHFLSQQLSYLELDRWADRVANYLRRHGVDLEARVGVMMERSPELVASLLGVLKAGGVYVPLDPRHPATRLKAIVNDAGIGIVLTQEQWKEPAASTGARVAVLHDRASGESEAPIESGISSENLAYIIYTSGSTGAPKGVQISHGAVISYLQWMQELLSLTDADRVLQLTSFSFDASIWELYAPLLAGAKSIMAPQGISDVADLIDLIREREITHLQLTPSLLRSLLEEEEIRNCRSLQCVLSCGEALPFALQERFFELHTAELFNFYGPTETAVEVTSWRCRRGSGERVVPIGHPASGNRIYLLNEFQQPAPVGVAGEIYIGGAQLARGYLNSPDLTAERFIPDLYSGQEGARLYRTGDLARRWLDGRIEHIGRTDHQVKVRGFRVELGEIEAAIGQHEAIKACVVIQNCGVDDQSLAAYLVMKPGPEPTANQLREFVKERLPEYMAPSLFIKLNELPLTSNGKIDRGALPSPDQSRLSLGDIYAPPRSTVELKLARIWERLLNQQSIGVTDDFFALGGHSLLAVRMFSLVEKELGERVRLRTFLKRPTIEHLASGLECVGDAWTAVVEIRSGRSGLPLFLAHPIGGQVFCYLDLARRIDTERPVYGLQSSGLDDHHNCSARIEEMASLYIESMRAVQPEGPYSLGGWSMGGVIAFEMARQLKEQGEEINLLALVDTAAPIRNASSTKTRDSLVLFRFATDLGLQIEKPPRSSNGATRDALNKYLIEVLEQAKNAGIIPEEASLVYLQRLFDVYRRNLQALQTYAPQPFAGKITLFNAADEPAPAIRDQDKGWKRVALHGVQVFDLPGAHHTILKPPYVQALAQRLGACLDNKRMLNGDYDVQSMPN